MKPADPGNAGGSPARTPTTSPLADSAAHEARIFSRYLIGADPPEDMIARYAAARAALFSELETGRDHALCDFVRRRPWSLPFLDAAAGVLAPQSLLRKKLLVMAAILEASPVFADVFLPRTTTRAYLSIRLCMLTTKSACKILIGVPMLLLIGKPTQ